MGRPYYVYILASRKDGAIYIGVTNNLAQRVDQHKSGQISGHTQKYNIHHLVYYEIFDDVKLAIAREKKLKRWRRAWKDELIVRRNPQWEDLSGELWM